MAENIKDGPIRELTHVIGHDASGRGGRAELLTSSYIDTRYGEVDNTSDATKVASGPIADALAAASSSASAATAAVQSKVTAIQRGQDVSISYGVPSLYNKQTLFIAHRGGSAMFPEESLEGFRQAYAAGVRTLECDVWSLSDGGLALNHDSTVDRTTTGTGSVSTFDTAGFKALKIDAGSFLGGRYGNNLHPVTFQDVAKEFSGKTIFCPEIKDGLVSTASTLLAAVQSAGIRKDQLLVQSFTIAPLRPFIAEGYNVLYANNTLATIDAVRASDGVEWFAFDGDAVTDTFITSLLSRGVKAFPYNVNRRYLRDKFVNLGCQGMYTDDPIYLNCNYPLSQTDRFDTGVWQPGMFGQTTDLTRDGKFLYPNWFGYDLAAGTTVRFTLMGHMCPIKANDQADDFTLDFSFRFDAVNSSTRWFAVWISDDSMLDRPYADSTAATNNGYLFFVRQNGSIEVARRDNGVASVLKTVSSGAITLGVETAFRIIVSPTNITIRRLDAAGAVVAENSNDDATHRGGYFHLGASGVTGYFRNVKVS